MPELQFSITVKNKFVVFTHGNESLVDSCIFLNNYKKKKIVLSNNVV